jgi:3-keto-L-gulonate-6-phosphate decarboxylase
MATAQIAVDVTDLGRALEVAQVAVDTGASRIEVGHPLIVFEGVGAIDAFAHRFPGTDILVDFMILAGSRRYVHAARDRGARFVTVTALAPEETIRECIEAGKDAGVVVVVDLFNVSDVVGAACHFAGLGAEEIMVHFGVDQKRLAPNGAPLGDLGRVTAAVDVPIAYATYDLSEARDALDAGASVIVQGEPMTSGAEREKELRELIRLCRTTKRVQ